MVQLEKDGIDTSKSKDGCIPEEPMPDISISLLDIQMPETPESTKGQISDGDTSRLESPKTVKPVLGKVQAKKRLMAFANKFKVLPQVKSNLSQHSTGSLKVKDKAMQDETNVNKSRKKTGICNILYNIYISLLCNNIKVIEFTGKIFNRFGINLCVARIGDYEF